MIFLCSTAGKEEEVITLWKECFPEDSDEYISWFIANKYDPLYCRAFEEDGKLAALLHLLPLNLRLGGKNIALPFVYGAGTLNEYRKRGYMRELLKGTFEEQRDKGISCMALYPFNYGFYRKTGFGLLDECAALALKVSELSEEVRHWKEPSSELTSLEPSDMLFVWSKGYQRFEVGPIRTLDRCSLRLEEWRSDGGRSICCRIEGKAVGYALFAPVNDQLLVEEIFYENGEALVSLIIALVKEAQRVECAILRCELPKDEFPHLLFSDSRGKAYLEPHAMFRIIDIPSLINGLETSALGSFCVDLEDELCKWNEGAFTITCEGGKMTAKRGGNPDCRCNIATLSTLVCGTIDAKTANVMGLFESNNAIALEAFPKKKAFFFEHY